jgi:Pyridoxamine 5'-phosphate oxidase
MSTNEPRDEVLPTAEQNPTVTRWAETRQQWSKVGTTFLATVRPDGRPHIVPVGSILVDDVFYFTSGQGTRKDKNLAVNRNCALSGSGESYDFAVEGTVSRVSDPALLARLADEYNRLGWPVTVQGDVFDAPFSAPTTGPAPYTVYRATPTVAFAFGTSENTVSKGTRYRF